MKLDRRDFMLLMGSSVMLPVFGSSFGARAQESVTGGMLRIFLNEPTSLCSAFNSAGQIAQISPKIFDGLVEYDFDMVPQPRLATSVELSADAKTLTIKLREGLRWHDGKPLTSADVQFSAMEVWKILHPRGRATYGTLREVETPDETTAIFRFSSPAGFVLNALNSSEAQVIPRHIYQGTDILTNPANISPVGSGPFRFVEWRQGEYILLERNPDYWDKGKPYLDRIVVLLQQDPSSRAIAFETQEVEFAGAVPVSFADARRLDALPYIEVPDKGFEAYGNNVFTEVNLRRPNLQDVRVRRAILHAIDREFILKNIFFGFGSVATGPVPQTITKFYTADVPQYPFDPELAQTLLDEAGFTPGADNLRLRLTIDAPPSGAGVYIAVAEYIKQALRIVGIDATIRSSDFATFYKRIYTDYDFDLTVTGASALTDPTIGVQRFFWSKNITPGVPFSNSSGYAKPETDALLEAAQREPDSQRRVEIFYKFQYLVVTDLPILPLADVPYFAVKNTRVHNSELTPFGSAGSFADVYLTP
ncbi:ABC transporter substrate-binding protein [Brenneria corticis]|uniref:ABC transporter substrate-binding protein n=1 Tax=Brenneria corticis TaxID=2173106 RepID=A0A2U1UD16_9GAMM|nr:ABC transporter substrate-binding protein [Brenneria sp. CFCC 11842]PWC19502.1 ABC transporter substrate-binding protein [Brenneria sp. CFCC 11842]